MMIFKYLTRIINCRYVFKISLPTGILKIGNRCTELESLTINNKKFILTNTCAFDSICQVVALAVSDNEIYKRHFELEKSNLLKKIILDIFKEYIIE